MAWQLSGQSAGTDNQGLFVLSKFCCLTFPIPMSQCQCFLSSDGCALKVWINLKVFSLWLKIMSTSALMCACMCSMQIYSVTAFPYTPSDWLLCNVTVDLTWILFLADSSQTDNFHEIGKINHYAENLATYFSVRFLSWKAKNVSTYELKMFIKVWQKWCSIHLALIFSYVSFVRERRRAIQVDRKSESFIYNACSRPDKMVTLHR